MRRQQVPHGAAGSCLLPLGYLVTCWFIRFQPRRAGTRLAPLREPPGQSRMMNGSDLSSTTGSSPKSKEDQVVNGHDEKENNPFAEYMWMENEEDFNRQVEEELQEQEFLDRCFQEMLEEEDQDWFIPSRDLPQGMGQLQQQLNGLSVCDGRSSEDILSKSNLNPDAKEFVPGVKY